MIEPADQSVRNRVVAELDQSFLVRAPAGSGKTGLLTQRFLGLLSRVENPEEIVAVTFTRKAAAEMRNRILNALEHAGEGSAPPTEAHELRYYELAKSALQQDAVRGWNLVQSPARIRVMTIDSLCASLARQMPLLSGFGAQPALTEDSRALYLEAAHRTLAELDTNADWSQAVEHLLLHLDNRAVRLADLLATMLSRRDQWLPRFGHEPREREELEGAFEHLVNSTLAKTLTMIPAPLVKEWIDVARLASLHSEVEGLVACAELSEVPACGVVYLPVWKGLVELLLIAGKPGWRRNFNAKLGFPAPSEKGLTSEEKDQRKRNKQRVADLIGELSEIDGLAEQLDLVRSLPSPEFEASQLEVLEALFQLLRISAAHLHALFCERGCVDFVQMGTAAAQALGEPEQPTDLALALDYRIQHLLVDEFQDTSQTQFKLLLRLTAGWTPDDGHTLLLVGDPMQSIYRFREANVGLFQQAREEGVGDLRPEPVELGVNFRSDAGIVDWVNQKFPGILPKFDDAVMGAVRYESAQPAHGANPNQSEPVRIHTFLTRQDAAEADRVVEIVREAQAKNQQGSIGLLARGRNHLKLILPALRAAGLRYRAIEIERLDERPVVQDLLSLTAALLHPADRIAWIAVLRAPWCGLDLADLLEIAGNDRKATLQELLEQESVGAGLSGEGRRRLDRILPALLEAVQGRLRKPLRPWVEGVWMAIGGPACVESDADLEDAQVYLQMLEEFEPGVLPGMQDIKKKTETLYAHPDPEGDLNLQIMTLHKSKGLEFDTVIIPRLGQATGRNDSPALRWMELPGDHQQGELLVAPIHGADGVEDERYKFLARMDRDCARLEDGRLIYVGATRARSALHLLGHVGVKEQEGKPNTLKPPVSGSLLEKLWPAVSEQYKAALAAWQPGDLADASGSPVNPQHPQRRLTLDWCLPAPPPAAVSLSETISAQQVESLEFSWAGFAARHVGTVAHRLLQHLAEYPDQESDHADWVREALRANGLSGAELDESTASVLGVVQAATTDPRGCWVLDPAHREARNELALTLCDSGIPSRRVIDRTFVDADEVRWIIDYKTGSHQGGDLEGFLDEEQKRYRPQLEGYATALSQLDTRSIRLGLWFPLLGGWREWAWEPGN